MRYARSPIRCLLPVGTCVALFYGRHIFSLLAFVVRQLQPVYIDDGRSCLTTKANKENIQNLGSDSY